jgi:hypothetical protein
MTEITHLTSFEVAVGALDKRIDLLYQSLHDRLELKDRWIQTQRDDLDERLTIEADHLQSDIQKLGERLDTAIDSIYKYIEASVAGLKDHHESFQKGHEILHSSQKERQEDFRLNTLQRMEVVQKNIDQLKEERALFSLRDAVDTKLEVMEKTLDSLRDGSRESLDISIKALKDQLEEKHTATHERIQKIEQSISITNARNQQSIIALGVLLTLVEIIIRFYN